MNHGRMLVVALVLALPLAGPLWVLAFAIPRMPQLLRDPFEPFGIVAMIAASNAILWSGLTVHPVRTVTVYLGATTGLFLLLAAIRAIRRRSSLRVAAGARMPD
jgi:hypothetical protein